MSCRDDEHDFDVVFSNKGRGAKELHKKCNRCGVVRVDLTPEEHALVLEALDSHSYWQLSEEHYVDSGFVYAPGNDEADAQEALKSVDRLSIKLGGEPITFEKEDL